MLKAMPINIIRQADEMRRMAARLDLEIAELKIALSVTQEMEPLRTLCDNIIRCRNKLESEQTRLIKYANLLSQVAEEYRGTELVNIIRSRSLHPADLRPIPVQFSESDFSDLHLNE